MAKRLTDKQVAELKRKPTRYVIKDPELRGHYVRIPPEGPAVFAAVARTPSRKQVWVTLGTTADLNIGEARERAQKALRRIKDGLPATETKPEQACRRLPRVGSKCHVDQKKLRTADEYRRIVDRYILPKWKDRIFVDLRRSDIAALMDTIEDKHGARQADMVLTTLSSIAAWVHKRDDLYATFRRGMRRAARGGRERVLSDEEIRRIWSVCDRPELYHRPYRPVALTDSPETPESLLPEVGRYPGWRLDYRYASLSKK